MEFINAFLPCFCLFSLLLGFRRRREEEKRYSISSTTISALNATPRLYTHARTPPTTPHLACARTYPLHAPHYTTYAAPRTLHHCTCTPLYLHAPPAATTCTFSPLAPHCTHLYRGDVRRQVLNNIERFLNNQTISVYEPSCAVAWCVRWGDESGGMLSAAKTTRHTCYLCFTAQLRKLYWHAPLLHHGACTAAFQWCGVGSKRDAVPHRTHRTAKLLYYCAMVYQWALSSFYGWQFTHPFPPCTALHTYHTTAFTPLS